MVGRRGISTAETLLALVVLLVFAAIMVPIALRIQRRGSEELDAERMRRVYVGLSLYQEENWGRMPQNLGELGDRVDRSDLVSSLDPFENHPGPFPVEPTMPGISAKSNYRISFAFLGSYLAAGKANIKSWSEASPHLGLLANPWVGKFERTGRFTGKFRGAVQRVRMDGAMIVLPNRTSPAMDSFSDLFGNGSEP